MAIPTSQLAPFMYSGAVVGTSTTQLIESITGMMLQMGWTTTGAGVLRCVPDNNNRFFEMEVIQNPGVTLSNQIQFAVYKTTKASDNNTLINRGFQMATGSTYKIYVTPYSVYTEANSSAQNNGNDAYALQLYCDPLTSGQVASAVLAGGHRNFAGSVQSLTSFSNQGSMYNGISGAAAAGTDFKFILETAASSDFADWKGGRIMMFEDWVSFGTPGTDPIFGRVYNTLVAGGDGVGGFEIPSGTGTITYTRLDAWVNGSRWSYYIRIA